MTQEDRSAIAVLAARFIKSGRTGDIMGLAEVIENAIERKLDLLIKRDAARVKKEAPCKD